LDFYMRLLYDPGQRFFFLRHEKKSRLIPFFCYQKIRSVEFLLALVFLLKCFPLAQPRLKTIRLEMKTFILFFSKLLFRWVTWEMWV
jgi:hypothetical protein